MELIKPGTNIDFVGKIKFAIGFSWTLIALGIISLIVRGGLNYGVDFAGGTVAQVRFTKRPPVDDIRGALNSTGMVDATIQDFGSSKSLPEGGADFLIRLPMAGTEAEDMGKRMVDALTGKFGKDTFDIQRIETVGPRVGSELRVRALLAVLFSTILMGAYISFRFEFRFGLGAAIALIHDVLITVGALSVMNYEFDLTIVAALLTVVGFSVHDTVIVSDRVRENMRKNRRDGLRKIINNSINETLSRTILTTGTAVLVLLTLYLLGGSVINGFAFALLIGFVIGTYSSIYVASPIVLFFERPGARTR
ncbi:MAG: protein translocase subunit SecF [Deltaproteobacteria bacterium]|nr:protein translocase subunit SecF [Deltaproteobacteria bacterium]